MEEREALKRQIELLQNLINKHKSIHGDTPLSGAESRCPEDSAAARGFHPPGSRGGVFVPQSRGSWRKTYSLRNKPLPSSAGHLSASTPKSGENSASVPNLSRINETALTQTASILSGGPAQQKKEGHINKRTGLEGAGRKKLNSDPQPAVLQHKDEKQGVTDTSLQVQQRPESNQKESMSAISPIKPPQTTKTRDKTSQVMTTQSSTTLTAGTFTPALPAPPTKQPSCEASTQNSQVNASYLTKSKFTWVKSQNTKKGEPKQAGPAKAEVPASSPSSSTFSKKTPPKKMARKLSPVATAPKTSKYKWVSTAGAQARTPRKPVSPKGSTPPLRSLEKGDATKKLKSASAPSLRVKKGIGSSSSGSSLGSRYRWKAGGQSNTGGGAGAAAATGRRSAFHWTAEKSSRGMKAGLVPPYLPQRTQLPFSSPGGFKLRSRMKIVRRSASSPGSSEKGSSPSAMKFPQRGRIHTPTRSPFAARRTPPRELVSFGRHKLRRLSPTMSRTSSASTPQRSPASRVFRTRYKMVARLSPGTGHALPYNPALSWRAKRIQSARTFLQSRLRAPPDRRQSPAQRWTGSGMRWIRGSLYRVSANKLSRTVTSSMSINRTGRSYSHHASHMSPALTRPSSSRHLASRAVQRSIAIIRHARQKKQQKQYCMYYNRFGKCNRGTSCPFIHDPDKVAVCTRFLRGTCKQAEGACPFSHKVAKEKMPVCSFFLKGICNNSNCPYSHVYVSRKAEVCEDFVRGYCPEGEKCKKKHTLVCLDFSKTGSCPRGSRCKLHHRQRAKRSASSSTIPPAKKVRSKEPQKRPCLSVVLPQDAQASSGMSTAGPLALPSFISLSSSPEEPDAPDTPQSDPTQVKEKKLQIKPRL